MLLARKACCDVLHRDVVFQQSRRVDQDLILFAIAALHEDFGDAGRLQQSRSNHPVGEGAKFKLLFRVGIEVRLVLFASDVNRRGSDWTARADAVSTSGSFDPLDFLRFDFLPSRKVVTVTRLPNLDAKTLVIADNQLRHHRCVADLGEPSAARVRPGDRFRQRRSDP